MPMRDDRMLTSKVVRDASNNYVRDLLSDHGLIRSGRNNNIVKSQEPSQVSALSIAGNSKSSTIGANLHLK